MSFANIWELIKINILYSNPQAVTNARKKQAKKPKKKTAAYKTILLQQAWLIPLFLFIYSYMFLAIDYRQSSGYFSFQVALFALIAIVMGFTTLFAVFYDSNDTKLYLSLPVKEGEVYLAKLLSAQGGSLPFLMPQLSLLIIAYLQFQPAYLALPLAFFNFLVLFLITNCLSIFLIYFIGRALLKSPHKKLISTALMFLSTLLAIGAIFYLQTLTEPGLDSTNQIIMPLVPYFRGFLDLIINPWSLASLLNYWLGLILLLALMLIIKQVVIKNYFKQFLTIQATRGQSRKLTQRRNSQTLAQTLRRHHLSTIKDGSLLIQAFLMPLIFAMALIGPILLDQGSIFADLPNHFFGTSFLIGLILGMLVASPTSLFGVAISLEKENYNFLKTLPFSFRKFLIDKFFLIALIQIGPLLLVYLIIGLVLKLPLILLLTFLLGISLTALLFGQISYWRDYRLLSLNWQNITQLFSRGIGQWLIMIYFLIPFILGSGLVILVIVLGSFFPVFLVNLSLFLIILLLAMALQIWLKHTFWKHLK